MKKNFVNTLPLVLLLSIPHAVHALPGDPFEQKTQLDQEITTLMQSLVNLKSQQSAIPGQKQELTLKTSQAKVDTALAVETGKKIDGLNLLAAETALLITKTDADLKAAQAKLPGLIARIKTLEPSANLEQFHTYQKNLKGIQEWNENNYTHYAATKYAIMFNENGAPLKGNTGKTMITQTATQTVKKSDKSAPYLPTKDEYATILRERKEAYDKSWTKTYNDTTARIASLFTSKKASTSSTTTDKQ